MIIEGVIFGLLLLLLGAIFSSFEHGEVSSIFLGLIGIALILGSIFPIYNINETKLHSSSLKEFNTCTEFLLYYPDANIISRGAVSMSAVPLECKGQFEAFYEAHTNWDLSYTWEKFKQYKIKQIT